MKAAILALCFLAALTSAEKIFGTRTQENTPSDWNHVGTADESSKLSFIVALTQSNLGLLEELFWDVSNPDSPNYRNFMSIAEINSLVAPAPAVQKKVTKWLISNGAEQIENRGDSISAKATVAVLSKLFNTEFRVFEHVDSGLQLVRQFGSFSVPEEFGEHVDFVAGLSEFPTPRFALKASSPEVSVSIAPQSIQVMYGTLGASITANGNSSAGVIEFENQYFSPKDLADFASRFAVPIPPVTANHIVGTNNPNSPQIEATLDIEYILGVATNAIGWFWIEDYNVWLYGFANHMFNTIQVPLVNSISYGWNEEAQCQAGIGGSECSKLGVKNTVYVQRVNVEFQKIGLRGVTLICASGDSGANGRTDPLCSEDHLNPVFPAASPFITSVGATQINTATGRANLPNPPPGCSGRSCASAGTEEAVSYSQARFTSGGGFSDIAPAPAHQHQAIANYLNSGVALPPASYFNKLGRGFPDVSAFGSNILILQDGSIEPVGGTSASAPIFGGIVALLNDYVNSKTGKPLGFISPLLYKMAVDAPTTFTDVTVGDNICTEYGCASNCKGFKAAKGWDPVTGLGTPNYKEMLKYIQTKYVDEQN